jgi:hypothetical protein
VRIARDLGSVSALLPPGCVSLIDAPFVFVRSIRAALAFLGWQENLEAKEVPPKRIWFDEDKLDAWFKDMRKQRELEMKGQSNSEEGWDGDFKRNEAAKMLIDSAER